jgi:excisionase family DNA binding protein
VKLNFDHFGSLMTIDEVAEYLRVKKRTVYDWVKKGKIPAIKAVGLWRFRRERIDAWLESDAEAKV